MATCRPPWDEESRRHSEISPFLYSAYFPQFSLLSISGELFSSFAWPPVQRRGTYAKKSAARDGHRVETARLVENYTKWVNGNFEP